MKKLFWLLTLPALLLTGCSPATPSSSLCRQIIETKIEKQANGRIKLISFSKLDGEKQDVMGISIYKMQYKIELEFLETCYWGPYNMDGSWSGDFQTSPVDSTPTGYFLSGNVSKRKVEKGQKTTATGWYTFEKTEKGWHDSEGVLLNEYQPPAHPKLAKWMKQAGQGDAEAEYQLARMYLNGDEGVAKNESEAERWYQRASDHGQRDAPIELANLMLTKSRAVFAGLRAQATRLEAKVAVLDAAEASDKCLDNMKRIALAAQLWAGDNNHVYPKDFISMSNELSNVRLLNCPADKKKQIPFGTSFQALDARAISYRMYLPGIPQSDENSWKVFVQCPVHGHCMRVDGQVVAGSLAAQ